MVIRRSVAGAALVLLAGLAGPVALPAQAQPISPDAKRGAATDASSVFGWHVVDTQTTEEFRGLAAVSAKVAWVSGESGTVLRTTTGGTSWRNVSPAGAKGLALRDIEARDGQHAVALSIGPGKQSGIFVTDDGGARWRRTFTNHNRSAFYDCLAFSKDGTGLAMSDPVNGHFRFVISRDWGHSWKLRVPHSIPRARGEFGFAASGTCLVGGPGQQFWAASGGRHPRIYHTFNAGYTWSARPTPIRRGPTAGIYSIAFHGPSLGIAVGGDYTDPTSRTAASATSRDGGRTWSLSRRQVYGYRSGVAFFTGRIAIAVGPTGSDVSRNGGATWSNFDQRSFDSVECAKDGTCWASGSHGAVAVFEH